MTDLEAKNLIGDPKGNPTEKTMSHLPAILDYLSKKVDFTSVNAAIGTNDPTQAPSVDVTGPVDGVLDMTFNNIKGAKGDQGEPSVAVENYVTVEATSGTTSATDVLPATGDSDTVYRVANWDGTQYDETAYTEYGWYNGAYKQLATRTPGIDDEPTENSSNLVKSGGVAAQISQLGQKMIVGDSAQVLNQDVSGIYTEITNKPITSYILVELELDAAIATTLKVDLATSPSSSYITTNIHSGPETAGKHYYIAEYDGESYIRVLNQGTGTYPANSHIRLFAYDVSKILYDNSIPVLNLPKAIDNVPTEGSGNHVKSGGVFSAVKNVDDKVEALGEVVMEDEQQTVVIPLTMHTESNTNGYWGAGVSGAWYSDNNRRGSEKISVSPSEKYLVTTKIGSSTAIAYLAQWNGDTWVGVASGFTGGSGDAVDKEYTVPSGVTKIAICSYNTTAPSLKKVTTTKVPTFYDKEESDEKYATKGEIPTVPVKYGVKWGVSDFDDLGTREFMAVGKTATIGIGSTNGASDFDSIYPWSGMKRCNINTNANGAKVVTFEGETGFALDGSNGDVFVRIPKFKTDRYIADGYEHIVIGDGYTHPAFIEDGAELDEIFIAAFEASKSGTALYSKAEVIPANNMTGSEFLAAAKEKGTNYSLYDMRCVDALWRLMAVEYGCRNSNQILGWGYSNYVQPNNLTRLKVIVSATATNTVTLAPPSSNGLRIETLQTFAPGNNLCICENTQTNIIAERKITSVVCSSTSDNVVITFEGAPIDTNTDMFVGNAPCDCNYCETIGDSWKLNWHTGRANRPVLAGIGFIPETCNPCRYRWIENPIGNVWHALPDVTFKDLQMYVCKSMKDYEMLRYTPPYMPVGAILPEQTSNGNKLDVNTVAQPNYWLTSLLLDIFAKGNNFGKSFDSVHDGTLTSQKGYGGYYYLYNGTCYIANGGGYDHLWRSNILTNRAWQSDNTRWYLYGARLMYKNLDGIISAE